ncbi:MAG: L-aspartate oxidase [Nitrospirae bacterium]|nr:L-aspartate oxidase [Nitrospirota bacterium]
MVEVSPEVLIVGGGVAGLRAALEAARFSRVVLINKERGNKSNSAYAQGGIAVALGSREDRQAHMADTLLAGRGLCRRKTVRILVDEGPRRVRELIRWGAEFDRSGRGFARAHEGAHSRRRILRARGDGIGAELTSTLLRAVQAHPRITVVHGRFTADLLVERGRCVGVWVLGRGGRRRALPAAAVVLATGGIGQVYLRTTNPPVATGDGIAMAYRAGALLEDLEFVQFHPTALAVAGAPTFLLSEAMRGEGAVLRTVKGEAFMARYDRRRELAPRDVVARAIWEEMMSSGADHVLLDVTARPRLWLRERFPLIARTCARYGIDIATTPIPVAPAAHFMIGGIKTDEFGATSLPGLYAVGETACTGVHGANRLASNSLLEGVVFGARTGRAAARYARSQGFIKPSSQRDDRATSRQDQGQFDDILANVRRLMWEGVGIIRSATSLGRALDGLRRYDWLCEAVYGDREGMEVQNIQLVATLIARAALRRRGSLGCHFRSDFPVKGRGWSRHVGVARSD